MIELDCASLSSKEPLKIRFSSDDFGQVALRSKADWAIIDRGIALEIRDEVRTRSIVSDGLSWFNFRAHNLGHWANRAEVSEELLLRLASENSDMVCHAWRDVESEYAHRFDFKRFKRPFVRFVTEVKTIGVLWEFYPSLGRLGVYIGKDSKGLGGYVTFLDEERFKILVQS